MDVNETDGSSSSVQMTNEKQKPFVRKKLFCGSCDYVTERAHRLARHEECHIIQYEHQCPHCSYSVPEKHNIGRHLRMVHKKDTLEIQENADMVKPTAMVEKDHQDNRKDAPSINGNEKSKPSATPNVVPKDKEESTRKRRKTSDGPQRATETNETGEVVIQSQAVQEDNEEVDQGEMIRTNLKRRGRRPLVSSGGPLVCRQVYLCPELDCTFWAQSVGIFHDHLASKHGTSPAYKCSACPFTADKRYMIGNHISSLQKARNKSHIRSAHTICTISVPESRYEAHLRFLAIPSDLSKGELADQDDDEKDKEVESLEAAIAEGFRKLKDVAKESLAKLKHLEEQEGRLVSTKALLLSEMEELNRKEDKLMSQKNKAEMALKMETTSKLSIRLVTKELEGINQELKTTKVELDNLTDRLEGGTALNKEIARQMSDARKDLADLEEEKTKQRSRIAAYKKKKRQCNQLRIQTIGFSMEAELNRKEVDWLAQLDQ